MWRVFAIKSPSDKRILVSQENAFKKSKNLSLFFRNYRLYFYFKTILCLRYHGLSTLWFMGKHPVMPNPELPFLHILTNISNTTDSSQFLKAVCIQGMSNHKPQIVVATCRAKQQYIRCFFLICYR